MNKPSLCIEIKPAEESQLELLENQFSPNNRSRYHHKRYDVQKRGQGIYLIAWHLDIPVGHFLLRWSGPHDDRVRKYFDITRSAFLEAGLTIEEYRRQGIATAIIRHAEQLAKAKGCTHIGLDVASKTNPPAKRLYEKLGFKDWGYGEFPISWEYVDINGNTGIESEIAIYMRKKL